MLKIEHLYKTYGTFSVIQDLNMSFEAGCIHCLIGPSGSGKTTLLNLITGIQQATSGCFTGFETSRVAYLFQEDRLLPWSTVEENVLFVLQSDHDEAAAKQKAAHYLEVVELSSFKDSKPNQLSGGMKQRVALARAFAYGGQWLVMDEPFKGLDRDLKRTLMDHTIKWCREEKKSLIYVTHDVQEAYYMADFIHEFEGPPLKWIKTTPMVENQEQRQLAYDKGTRVKSYDDSHSEGQL